MDWLKNHYRQTNKHLRVIELNKAYAYGFFFEQ